MSLSSSPSSPENVYCYTSVGAWIIFYLIFMYYGITNGYMGGMGDGHSYVYGFFLSTILYVSYFCNN